MVYFGRLKGMDNAAPPGAGPSSTWTGSALADKATIRLDKLSGGQQQKVQLGVTIMNDPELLILDEPTKGFDPVNRRLLMDIIAEQKLAGATVVMVTHQMEEVERLCDRVILLKDGTADAYGTIDEVQNKFGGRIIRINLQRDHPRLAPLRGDARRRPTTPNSSITDATDEAAILKDLIDDGVAVRSFTTTKVSLEEIFIRVYGDQHNLAAARPTAPPHAGRRPGRTAPSHGPAQPRHRRRVRIHPHHEEAAVLDRHPGHPGRHGDRVRAGLPEQLLHRRRRRRPEERRSSASPTPTPPD